MVTPRAYKFRIEPTAAQCQQLAVEFGCARFVWNRGLALRSEAWKARQEKHNYVSLSRQVTVWKKAEFPWLADATAACLTQALIDQDKAFQNFFAKRGQYPQFKSKGDRQSVRYPLDQRKIHSTYGAGEFLKVPKLGFVKVRWSRIPTGTPKMATVSKDASGRFFVSFSCEEVVAALPQTGVAIGLDLGIKDVVVANDGFKSGNPRHLKKQMHRLKFQQRRLSRMQKGSNRRRRQRQRVARIHAHIAAMRADFLHKTTTEMIRRADVLALEDLNVSGMMKNHHLAGAIADVGMHEFKRQLEYKAAWYGRRVVVANRFAPTSKTCSECGSYQPVMPLHVREWTCPDCGTRHDRDVNAAKNILSFALRQAQDIATAGEAGIARGGSKNLLSHALSTPVEARTEAKKFTEAGRLERAASSKGADSNVSDRTDQLNYPKEQERAATSEPEQASESESASEPIPSPSGALSSAEVIPIPQKTRFPNAWHLPDEWREWAQQQRPDLVDLDRIAATFRDYHVSKNNRSASWIAEWRIWIRRERAPKMIPPTAAQPASRTPTPPLAKAPISDAIRKAQEDTAWRAQVQRYGYDPDALIKQSAILRPRSSLAIAPTEYKSQEQLEEHRREMLAALEVKMGCKLPER